MLSPDVIVATDLYASVTDELHLGNMYISQEKNGCAILPGSVVITTEL